MPEQLPFVLHTMGLPQTFLVMKEHGLLEMAARYAIGCFFHPRICI